MAKPTEPFDTCMRTRSSWIFDEFAGKAVHGKEGKGRERRQGKSGIHGVWIPPGAWKTCRYGRCGDLTGKFGRKNTTAESREVETMGTRH